MSRIIVAASIRSSSAARGEVYNIGGRSECENITLVRSLCAVADECFERRPELSRAFPMSPQHEARKCESLIRFVNDRPGHDRRYAINCEKIDLRLGIRPHPPRRWSSANV